MLRIHHSDITILPSRQRQEFNENALRELGESIEKLGLFNALVVRPPRPEETVGTKWVLVQGERRYRAITEWIWPLGGKFHFSDAEYRGPEEGLYGTIPCSLMSSLTAFEAEEAEFEENFRREDLTWQEEAAAIAKLADLRKRQAESLGNDLPTVADIALEIRGKAEGKNQEVVRQNLIVARYLHDPDVMKSENVREAFKLLKRKEATRQNIELSDLVGRTYTSDVHQLYQADCVEWMQGQPPEQFDIILTDPPYGIDAQDFGDADGRLQRQTHGYDDSLGTWRALMAQCTDEWFRLAKPLAHAYICCDVDNFCELKALMAASGWTVHRTPIINHKVDGSRVPWPDCGPQRKWEMILYAIKGKRPTLGIFPDLIQTRGDSNLGHGAQKPVVLYTNLLCRSARAGDSVLDSFCGTGTVFAAADALRLRAVGVELDSASHGIAYQRLKQLTGTE